MTPNPTTRPPLAEQRLVYALDNIALSDAIQAVRALAGVVKIYKIGPSLIYQGGLDAACQIVNAGRETGQDVKVFLDMKTNDIPETVLNAIDAIEKYGKDSVVFATIHTAHVDLRSLASARGSRQFKIIAVTHLTSLDESDLRQMGVQLSLSEYVRLMAQRAYDFGCDGVVCSGLEARMIKTAFGPDFTVVTPGIRPAWAAAKGDDQKRVVTPKQAILNGADHLVVGRPIRNAPDPVQAAREIQQEIQTALDELAEDPEPHRSGGSRLVAASS